MDKSRVSQLPLRARVATSPGGQDSFHFSKSALAASAAMPALPAEPMDAAAPRPAGLLFRTASALFPHAGRLADTDAAANSNLPMQRPSRDRLSNELAWATIAAAVGLSVEAVRVEASNRDVDWTTLPPLGEQHQDVAKPTVAAHVVPMPDHAASSLVAAADEETLDSNDAVVAAAADELVGNDGSDALSSEATASPSGPAQPEGSSHFVIDGVVDPDSALADTGIQAATSLIVGTDRDDYFQASPGNITIDGGAGIDTVEFKGSVEDVAIAIQADPVAKAEPAVTVTSAPDSPTAEVNSTAPESASTPVSTTTLINIEQLTFQEGTFNLVTADDTHTAQGTAAADIVVGSGDGTVLIGGQNNDVLIAGGSLDTASFSGAVEGYRLSLSQHDNVVVQDQSSDRDGKDILIGVDSVSFDDAEYVLNAGTKHDDILVAGSDAQLMVGGAGEDIFVFNSTIMAVNRANAVDMIADFTQGEDCIDLRWITLDALGQDGDGFVWDGDDRSGDDNSGSGHRGDGHVGYRVEQVDNDWRTVVDGRHGGSGSDDDSFTFHIALRGRYELSQSDFNL